MEQNIFLQKYFKIVLVFILVKKHIKNFTSTTRIDLCKANGISEENTENIAKSDSKVGPTFVAHHLLPNIYFIKKMFLSLKK